MAQVHGSNGYLNDSVIKFDIMNWLENRGEMVLK